MHTRVHVFQSLKLLTYLFNLRNHTVAGRSFAIAPKTLLCASQILYFLPRTIMHRALLIPEIVTQIIDCNRSDAGYLHTCLLINALFFHSTARILWHGCGVGSSTKGHVTPYVRHLVWIARRDARRGQFYAGLVKLLRFGKEVNTEDEDEVLVGWEHVDENCYHEELHRLNLEWANIEELEIAELEIWNEEREATLTQYLQPKLKKIALQQRDAAGDDFLEMLSERCPGLKWLALKPRFAEDGVSKQGFLRFLGKYKLESLNIRADADSWERDWELWMLELLSKQGNLKHISIPDLEDASLEQWANGMEAAEDIAFPGLISLRTGLSASGLRSLHRVKPCLSTLCLDQRRIESSTCSSTLLNLSVFSQLSDLSIQFPAGMRIYGDDLTHLVQSCPSLSRLSIAKDIWYTERPWSINIHDSHIETLARSAVNMKELYLLFDVPGIPGSVKDFPTHVALESLGRHCVNLERLWLTCDPDWFTLLPLNGPRTVLFPKVWDLGIAGPELRYTLSFDTEDNLRDMAEDFVARCPKLSKFSFLLPYAEDPWDETVMEVIRAKTRRD